jgi:hypothetical protein
MTAPFLVLMKEMWDPSRCANVRPVTQRKNFLTFLLGWQVRRDLGGETRHLARTFP